MNICYNDVYNVGVTYDNRPSGTNGWVGQTATSWNAVQNDIIQSLGAPVNNYLNNGILPASADAATAAGGYQQYLLVTRRIIGNCAVFSSDGSSLQSPPLKVRPGIGDTIIVTQEKIMTQPAQPGVASVSALSGAMANRATLANAYNISLRQIAKTMMDGYGSHTYRPRPIVDTGLFNIKATQIVKQLKIPLAHLKSAGTLSPGEIKKYTSAGAQTVS